MISARNLTKHYGDKVALNDVSFDIQPGLVTGFLGPNGAGKSTSMRLMLGLDKPTSGTVTIGGRSYADHQAPVASVGALLEAKGVHPGRSARSHLRAMAATHGIGVKRVDEVLEMTGLAEVAKKRAGGFSLGMGQRLGIAGALLGDPEVLILDEPVNGLDPDGVRWVRELLRGEAARGKTVLLSSHLMSEMAQTADHVIVLGKGKVIADVPIADLLSSDREKARVVVADHNGFATALGVVGGPLGPGVFQTTNPEVTVEFAPDGTALVDGLSAAQVGKICFDAGVMLQEVAPVKSSLEDAYMQLTHDAVEFKSGATK